MSTLNEEQLKGFRAALDSRAKSLRSETAELDDARTDALERTRGEVEDTGDQAEARRHDEVRGAEEQRDLDELRAIDAALARLDAGTYGQCVDCNGDIPLARLHAQPAASRCIACQTRFEQATQGGAAPPAA